MQLTYTNISPSPSLPKPSAIQTLPSWEVNTLLGLLAILSTEFCCMFVRMQLGDITCHYKDKIFPTFGNALLMLSRNGQTLTCGDVVTNALGGQSQGVEHASMGFRFGQVRWISRSDSRETLVPHHITAAVAWFEERATSINPRYIRALALFIARIPPSVTLDRRFDCGRTVSPIVKWLFNNLPMGTKTGWETQDVYTLKVHKGMNQVAKQRQHIVILSIARKMHLCCLCLLLRDSVNCRYQSAISSNLVNLQLPV